MKSTVDDAADNKLKSRDYCASGKASDDQAFGLDLYVCNIDYQKSDTARYRHCPMGKSTENHFNKAVNYSAGAENDQIFF